MNTNYRLKVGKVGQKVIDAYQGMKKKLIIGILVSLVIVIGFASEKILAGHEVVAVGFIELQKEEMINSITTKGIVESMEKRNIYTTLNFPVQEIYVEAGTLVTEGQELCILDTGALDLDIEQKKAELSVSQQNYLKQLADAELNFTTAKELFTNNQILYEAGAVSRVDYENSRNTYQASQTNLEATRAQNAANDDSQIITVKKLEKQKEDSVIKAPISGEVTAVYAKEGAPGTGVLFVIEDTNHLKITTKIEEFDVNNVKTGMTAIIKTDSTGDSIYDGFLSKIASTAVKNAQGDTDTSEDIEFDATIDVTSKQSDLKIGLNARLTIILEKKEDVYFVPSDAIAINEEGETVIYTVVEEKENKTITRSMVVLTGMETDFYTEIIGTELMDGIKIISDSSEIKEGMQINLK